jgi:hypothetical protein
MLTSDHLGSHDLVVSIELSTEFGAMMLTDRL